MKRNFLFAAIVLATASVLAADPSPREIVESAARKLADQANYSWQTIISIPQQGTNSGPRSGMTDGKTEKGGYTWLDITRDGKKLEAVLKGSKGAIKTPAGWKSLADAVKENGEGPNPIRMVALMLLDHQLPTTQVVDLAEKADNLVLTNGTYAAKLSDHGAKQLLSFRRAGMGAPGAPTSRDVSGFVRFWVKDGLLSKCEFNLQGIISFGGNDHKVDRTTVIEIKNVGTTKFTVPEEAIKKVSQ